MRLTWTLLAVVTACLLASASAKIGEKSRERDSLQITREIPDSDNEEDGSGDDYDYDGEYDQEDDEDYDDEEEGSGDSLETLDVATNNRLIPDEVSSTTTTTTAKPDDIHFEDTPSKKGKDDGDLYEYYNEYYEEDYDEDDDEDDEDDEDYDDEDEDEEEEEVVVRKNDLNANNNNVMEDETPNTNIIKIGYIYIMLASAFVSFALALMFFFVCRRSALERDAKQSSLFVVSSSHPPPGPGSNAAGSAKAPPQSIVKSYQRVPTSTREFLENQNQTVIAPSEKPLLA